MKVNKHLFLAMLLATISFSASAQNEGAIFSLYSQYGIGNLSALGTAASKGMGGIGIASRDMLTLNPLNPASYTTSSRQSVLFSISGEGMNSYLKTANGDSNGKNYFNLGHIGLQFRLSNKFGFGLIVAPYSNMGYELNITEKNPDIIANIGNIRYDHSGYGGVAQFKTGFAYNPFKNLNIGVNYIYYLGNFTQNMNTTISSYVSNDVYKSLSESNKSKVNQSSFEVGAQYSVYLKENKTIILGATFQPRLVSEFKKVDNVTSMSGVNSSTDLISSDVYGEEFYFPMTVAFGVSYNTPKLLAELNYNYQDWDDSFPSNNIQGINYTSKQEIRGGLQYTPSRFNIRSQLKRWTYRLGFMYGNSYVMKNDLSSPEYSGSIGLGIPMERNWLSLLNAAVEVGQSGSLNAGQVKTTFVKLNIGFSFSVNNWFIRHKYK